MENLGRSMPCRPEDGPCLQWCVWSSVCALPRMGCVSGGRRGRSDIRMEVMKEQNHNFMCGQESHRNARDFAVVFSSWSTWAYIAMTQVSPSWHHSGPHIFGASCTTLLLLHFAFAFSFIYLTATFGSPLQQNHSPWPQRGHPFLVCSCYVHTLLKRSKYFLKLTP